MSKALPVLLTPLGASFRCSACGDCCRTPWGINVDGRAAQAIEMALARRPHPSALRANEALVPLEAPRADAAFRLGRRADGACVFLDVDSLCYLHKHFGPELKPTACRTYPFRPVRRPDAVVAPGSLSCRTFRRALAGVVSAPAPGLVQSDDPALVSLAELFYDRYSPGAPAKLLAERSIRIEALVDAEERLAALLATAALSLPERLLGMRLFVEELLLDPAPTIVPRAVGPAYERAVGRDLSALRRRLPALRPSTEAQLLLWNQLIGHIGQNGGSEQRARHERQFGGLLDLSGEERGQIAACVFRTRDSVEEPAHLPLLLSFLHERLRASNITMRYGLVATVQALILGVALVRAYSSARAGERQRRATREDLLHAIEEVDLLLFHNLSALALLADAKATLLGLDAALQLAQALEVAPPEARG